MLVYSTDHSFTEQPSASTMQKLQSHQSRRCDTRPLSVPFLSVTISPANPRILFTEYPTADGLFFTLVELDEALGVVLANISEAYAATL